MGKLSGLNKLVKGPPRMPVEEQIEVFKSLGIVVNEGIDIDKEISLSGDERSEYEREPFRQLIYILGDDSHENLSSESSNKPVSNQLMMLSFEQIERPGDYVAVLQDFNRITGGEFALENIQDEYDGESETVSVSFDFKGEHYCWDLVFDDDWLDGNLFVKLIKLGKKHGVKGGLYIYDGDTPSVLIWATQERIQRIAEKTGLDFIPYQKHMDGETSPSFQQRNSSMMSRLYDEIDAVKESWVDWKWNWARSGLSRRFVMAIAIVVKLIIIFLVMGIIVYRLVNQ